MGGSSRYKSQRGIAKRPKGWQKSVADIMEEQGYLIPNEKLDPKHPKIKNPALGKK